MKILEAESRLKRHAEITKSVMHTPFDTEREEFVMPKKNSKIKPILLVAAIVCLLATTAFAAYGLMSARDVAKALGDTKLAEYFEKQGTAYETVADGDYKATVLGIVSGENLSSIKSSEWEVFSERTYAVVAVEKSDGSEMTYDDTILVTPLIQGLKPWQYNIFTMNGGYSADIIDGVLYRIIEFDSVEYFADREVYMAVVSESFLNNKPYSFDEITGKIAQKEDYEGTNILIKLKLDKSKANPQKAEEYLKKLDEKAEDDEYTGTDEDENVEISQNSDYNVEVINEDGCIQVNIS